MAKQVVYDFDNSELWEAYYMQLQDAFSMDKRMRCGAVVRMLQVIADKKDLRLGVEQQEKAMGTGMELERGSVGV